MRRAATIAFVLGAIVASAVLHDRFATPDVRRVKRETGDRVLRVVILGDSIAHGAGDESGRGIGGFLQCIRGSHVIKLGTDGARTSNIRALLRLETTRVAIRTADVVIVSIGGNDLYGDSIARLLAAIAPRRQQEKVVERIDRLVRSVQRVNPATTVYLLGLYNPYRGTSTTSWVDEQVNRWDARLIGRFANVRRVTVIRICDLFERNNRLSPIDRFHPGARGYESIAQRIAAAM
jgi:lysophospholipase L1-like esterase